MIAFNNSFLKGLPMPRDDRKSPRVFVELAETESGYQVATGISLTREDASRFSSISTVIARRFRPARKSRRFFVVQLDRPREGWKLPRDVISPPADIACTVEHSHAASELVSREQGLSDIAARNSLAGPHGRAVLLELGRREAGPVGMIEIGPHGLGWEERRFYSPVRVVVPTKAEIATYRNESAQRPIQAVAPALVPELCEA
jgi:hypothetical protein